MKSLAGSIYVKAFNYALLIATFIFTPFKPASADALLPTPNEDLTGCKPLGHYCDHHFTTLGSYSDQSFSIPERLRHFLITHSGTVLVAGSSFLHEFDKPTCSSSNANRIFSLTGSHLPIISYNSYMGQDENNHTYLGNKDGYFYLDPSKGVQEIPFIEDPDGTKYGDSLIKRSMVINNDRREVWSLGKNSLLKLDGNKPTRWQPVKLPSSYSTMAGHGNTLYLASSIDRNAQSKLTIQAVHPDRPEPIWRRDFRRTDRSFLCYNVEVALSEDNVFVLCHQDIFVLRKDCGEMIHHVRIENETERLNGLVIDDTGKLFTQGKHGLYSLGTDKKVTTVPISPERTPGPLLLTNDNRLIITRVENNKTPFASPLFESSELTILIFNLADGGIRLENEVVSLLDAQHTGVSKNTPGAYPIWWVDSMALSDSGNLYILMDNLTFLNGSLHTSGTSFLRQINLGLNLRLTLSTTAFWPKRFHDNQQTNRLPSENDEQPVQVCPVYDEVVFNDPTLDVTTNAAPSWKKTFYAWLLIPLLWMSL